MGELIYETETTLQEKLSACLFQNDLKDYIDEKKQTSWSEETATWKGEMIT